MPESDPVGDRPLDVRITVDADAPEAVVHVSLSGRLDISSVEHFEHALRRAQTASPDLMVFDLRRLDGLDPTGLFALLGAHGRMRAQAARVIFLRGSPAIQRLFRRVGLEDLLEFREVLGWEEPRSEMSGWWWQDP